MAKRVRDSQFSGLGSVTRGQSKAGKDLATIINQVEIITHVVTSGEDTAGSFTETTHLTDATGIMVDHKATSGAKIATDIVATISGATLTVADGSGVALTATDIVTILLYKAI